MNTIDVACPQCEKKIKATDEHRGKKVRCKGCGHIFTLPAAEAEKAAPAKQGPVKIMAKRDDEEGGGSYSLSKEEDAGVARCPHCAAELESTTVRICINCGYDMATRQRLGTKRTMDVTAADRSAWLLPGFIAIAAIFGLIFLDLFVVFALGKIFDENSDYSWLNSGPVKLWTVILSVIGMLALGKFAFGRLVLNPNPPEQTRG
jgi:hypothetical protein